MKGSIGSPLGRGLLVVVTLEVLAVALRYILQVALARLAGPEQYGSYTFAITWAQTLSIPGGLGLSSVVIRLIPAYLSHNDTGYLAGLLKYSQHASLFTSGVIAVIATSVALALPQDHHQSLVLIFAFGYIPLLTLSTLQSEILRGSGHLLMARVIPIILQPLLILVSCLIVATLSGELTAVSALACLTGSTIVVVLLQILSIRRVLPRPAKSSMQFAKANWLRLGRSLLGIKLCQLVLNTSDILIVGMLLGVLQAGFYAVAIKTASLASLVMQAVNLAVPPSIAGAHAQGDMVALEAQLRWTAKVAFIPSVVLAFMVGAFAKEILAIFGGAFTVAESTLMVLAAGRLATAWTGPVGSVLSVTGHQNVNLLVYLIAAILQLALDFLLIPHLGILGAAIASTVAVTFWNGALFIAVTRQLTVRLWPVPLKKSVHG